MFIGSALCHQIPERSYFFGDLQMPLCARCIGIHFGFLLSTTILAVAGRRLVLEVPSLRRLVVLGAIMTFFFIDSGLSYSGISPSDNLRRTLSGLSLGVPLAFFAISMLSNLPPRAEGAGSPMGDIHYFMALAGAFALGLALILVAESALAVFVLVSVVGLAGMFLLYTALISLGILLLTDGRGFGRRRVIWVSLPAAVVILAVLAVAREFLFP
jgi:uncharacterized membrane protein